MRVQSHPRSIFLATYFVISAIFLSVDILPSKCLAKRKKSILTFMVAHRSPCGHVMRFSTLGTCPMHPQVRYPTNRKIFFFTPCPGTWEFSASPKKNHVTFTVWAIERKKKKSDFDGVEKKHFFSAHKYHEFLHSIHFVCFPSQKFEILNI